MVKHKLRSDRICFEAVKIFFLRAKYSKAFHLIALLVLALILNFTFIQAQEEKPADAEKPLPIKQIDIVGLKTFKKEEIISLIKSKVNDNFDPAIWANDKVILFKTGYFKSIEMKEKPRSKYINLSIEVEESDFKRTVKSIEIIGLKNIPQAQIIANMKTQVGIDFDVRVFDRDLIKLHSMSFSKDIKAQPERTIDGYVIKIYMAEDIDWYDEYDVKMIKGFKGGVIKNLEEQILLSKDGDYLDETHIDMVKRRLREYFKTKGYYFPDIQSSVRIEKYKKVLLFTIDRGPKVKVGGLTYDGNIRFSQKFLYRNAEISEKPYRLTMPWRFFNESKLDEDRAKLHAIYNNYGFVNAKIEFDSPIYNASKDRVYLKFNIEEGPRYFIGDIKFIGNTLYTREDILTVLRSIKGSYFNVKNAYDDAKNIEGLYGEEGRCFTVVEPKFNFDTERHIVNIVYSIKESGIIKIGKVVVNGNDVTKETVFLKELEIFPGDIYDKVKYDRSKFNIQRLPFIEGQELKMELIKSGDDTGDLVIEVKEKRSGSISFTLSANEIESFGASIKVSETNFNWQSLFGMAPIRGGGQGISAEGRFGLKEQRYSISFLNPMIFDLPIKFGMTSYLTDHQYREYDQTQLGGKISLSKKLVGDMWVGLGYKLEQVEISDVDDNVVQLIKDEDKNYLVSTMSISFTIDKRNNFAMPSSGYRIELGEAFSENMLIGERSFTTTSFELSSYFHLADKVDDLYQKKYPYFFIFHVEGASNFEYDDDSVPLSERMRTGGSSSVRGFKPGRLGPKDEEGRLSPGNFKLVGNFEFNLPLYKEIIYLAPFVDAGYVWEDIKDFDVDDFRSSMGLTFKFRIPALNNQPIMLSLSYPLSDKGDEEELFSFSFVTAF